MPTSAAEYRQWLVDAVRRMPAIDLPIGQAEGYTLAGDQTARHDLPRWRSSAMDGYAVRHADLSGPVTLRVVGEVAAGSAADPRLGPGEAVRIMTGAPVPSDADTVIPVEDTSPDVSTSVWALDEVTVRSIPAPGAHIRGRGEDVRAGDPIAWEGDELTPARAAALAAAGVAEVPVRARPRVAVFVTGSELRAPGDPIGLGEIVESNSVLLAGILRRLGIDEVRVEVVADDPVGFAEALSAAGSGADVVLTTGGIGPGIHDIVRIAAETEPGVEAFEVAVRPAKHQCAGPLRGGAWLFALPGNPVSAAVSMALFVTPALLAMQGRTNTQPLTVPMRAVGDWPGRSGVLHVVPVRVEAQDGALVCEPVVRPRAASHAVGGHGDADGYALLDSDRGDIADGETVPVLWR